MNVMFARLRLQACDVLNDYERVVSYVILCTEFESDGRICLSLQVIEIFEVRLPKNSHFDQIYDFIVRDRNLFKCFDEYGIEQY